MIIYHNIASLNSSNRLKANTARLSKSLNNLSSGLRINNAADDAAGLAISEKMRSSIRGLSQAARNAQDGVSLIQTAEGAMGEIHSVLQKARELAVQAANSTYTSEDRKQLQNEINQLISEVDRISSTTQFNTKNLLDGSMSALTSTSSSKAEVYIRDGAGATAPSGQKTDYSGNYRVEVTAANPGQGQVQKSNIFNAPLVDVVIPGHEDEYTKGTLGLTAVLGAGNVTQSPKLDGTMDTTSGSWTYTYGSGPDRYASAFIDFSGLGTSFKLSDLYSEGFSSTCATCDNYYSIKFVNGSGDKYKGADRAYGYHHSIEVDISGCRTGADVVQRIMSAVKTKYPAMTSHFTQYAYQAGDPAKLYIYDNRPYVLVGGNGSTFDPFPRDIEGVPDIVDPVVYRERPIENCSQFYDTNGKYLLEDRKTLTLTQGDGKTTSVTLYGSDTVESILERINYAIGVGLGQNGLNQSGAYYANSYATFVAEDNLQKAQSASGKLIESVAGTIIIRSAIPGADGTITFSGDDDILQALGLADVVPPQETVYLVSVYDAHTNEALIKDVEFSGNMLAGIIDPPGVDMKIAANTALEVLWNANSRSFEWPARGIEDLFVHIKDNALTLQIGAGARQNLSVTVGDYSSKALGIHNMLVISNEHANAALQKIDHAIARVSSARAMLGSVQNRLEHTITNLSVSSENLAASESRIRDLDMAHEMMESVKLNVLVQSATAMLSHSNALPQMILKLMQ